MEKKSKLFDQTSVDAVVKSLLKFVVNATIVPLNLTVKDNFPDGVLPKFTFARCDCHVNLFFFLGKNLTVTFA